MLSTISADFREWQAQSPIWRLTALATGYTIIFMIMRWIATLALSVFTNIWIAGAVAAVVASIIIFPSVMGNVSKLISEKAAESKNKAQVLEAAEHDEDEEADIVDEADEAPPVTGEKES